MSKNQVRDCHNDGDNDDSPLLLADDDNDNDSVVGERDATFATVSRGILVGRQQKRRVKAKSTRFNGNYFIGSQSIFTPKKWIPYRVAPFAGHDYDEQGYDMLTELRAAVTSTGMNQFKFKFNPTSIESYQMGCANVDNEFTLTDLAKQPEMVQLFSDQRLQWYFMWVNTFNLPKALAVECTDSILHAEYEEMYNWAVHMLTEYEYTNKVFFVGHWEGDWSLMMASGCSNKKDGGFNFACVPSDEVIERYIKWSQVRQRAIDDAKAYVSAEGVDIFHYIEFNFGTENYDSDPTSPHRIRPTILNSVVPTVNPDFLSFSSYKMTNAYNQTGSDEFDPDTQDRKFWGLLDYAESKLKKTQTNFSVMRDMEKRVFVGEFGPKLDTEPSLAAAAMAQIFRASLTWGCPFVLQWEIYDNNSTTPLIPRDNGDMFATFTPSRQLIKDWVGAANAYVSTHDPTQNQLRLWAVSWFDSVARKRRLQCSSA